MSKQSSRFVKFREGLHKLYLPSYDKLCSHLAAIEYADGSFWAPYCGLRSESEQNRLYAIGRGDDLKVKTVTKARAFESAHNFGMASDWVLFAKDGIPRWETKHWEDYHKACQEIGLVWGGNFSFVDKPHNELKIGIPWKYLRDVVLKDGEKRAYELIAASIPAIEHI